MSVLEEEALLELLHTKDFDTVRQGWELYEVIVAPKNPFTTQLWRWVHVTEQREPVPTYVLGNPSPGAFSRGKRGIVASVLGKTYIVDPDQYPRFLNGSLLRTLPLLFDGIDYPHMARLTRRDPLYLLCERNCKLPSALPGLEPLVTGPNELPQSIGRTSILDMMEYLAQHHP